VISLFAVKIRLKKEEIFMKFVKKRITKLLLCFGVLIAAGVLSPITAEAHNDAMKDKDGNMRTAYNVNKNTGTIYDASTEYWMKKDGINYAGWFCCDKQKTSNVTWYTEGYYITFKKIGSNYNYTEDSKKEGKGNLGVYISRKAALSGYSEGYAHNGMVDTPWVFNETEIYTAVMDYKDALAKIGKSVSFETDKNGYIVVYAQARIGVKKNDKVVSDYANLRSLSDWVAAGKNYGGWANTSTFKNHYNIPIHFDFKQNVNINYQTLEAGTRPNGDKYKGEVQLYDDVGDSLKQDGVSKLKVGEQIQLKSDEYQLMRENAIKTMKVKSNGSTSTGLTWALTGIKVSRSTSDYIFVHVNTDELDGNVVVNGKTYTLKVEGQGDLYANKKKTFLKNNEVTYTGTDADTPASDADAAGGLFKVAKEVFDKKNVKVSKL
jgi:hypothetical protein